MNTQLATLTPATKTMSSREIAELTGKEHFNVVIDIKKMLEALKLNALDFSRPYKTSQGNTYEEYLLPHHELHVLLTGYSIPLRSKVLKRWEELEIGARRVKDSYQIADPVERAQRWIEEQRAVRKLEADKNKAVETAVAATEKINELKPYKEYVKEISDSKSLHTANEMAAMVGMSAVALNKNLNKHGIIYSQGKGDKKVWLLASEYRDKGIAKMVTHRYFDSDGNPQTKNYLKWTEKGKQLIFNMQFKYQKMAEVREFLNL